MTATSIAPPSALPAGAAGLGLLGGGQGAAGTEPATGFGALLAALFDSKVAGTPAGDVAEDANTAKEDIDAVAEVSPDPTSLASLLLFQPPPPIPVVAAKVAEASAPASATAPVAPLKADELAALMSLEGEQAAPTKTPDAAAERSSPAEPRLELHRGAPPPPASAPRAEQAAQVPEPSPEPATLASTQPPPPVAEGTKLTSPVTAPGHSAAHVSQPEAPKDPVATLAPTPTATPEVTASASAGFDTSSGFESGSDGRSKDEPQKVEATSVADDDSLPNATGPAAAASNATAEIKAGPQTIAHLATQIIKKLESRSTQFEVALNPHDLGRVDVRIEISSQGKLTASMLFETPQAAAELRGRAGELQKALEQAGFDISGGLRFDIAADRGQGGQGQFGQDTQNQGGARRSQAFQAALDNADATADLARSGPLNLQRRTQSGVDVRI